VNVTRFIAVVNEFERPPSQILRGLETVLLVDDDEMVRGLAQIVLETHRHTVLPARNAEEAMELAHDHAGVIDVIMTDMVMPGMAGSDLAERLRQLRPGLRVIVTSGYAGRGQDFIESLGSRAVFLHKPYTPNMLTRKIREVLDSSGDRCACQTESGSLSFSTRLASFLYA
jgi:DNA-binding NtrC family response regulator